MPTWWPKGAWLLTGRRTYYDLVANSIVGTDLPSFGDLQGRLEWRPHGGRRLTLSGLLSRESADSTFTGEGDHAGEQGTFVTDTSNDVLALGFDTPVGR